MILITGGAGYLGSHVSRILGPRAIVYDNLLYRDEYLDESRFVYGDVTDHDTLKFAIDEADMVVWLAAIVGDAACNVNPHRAQQVNVESVRFLAEYYTKPIIYISTASVYGVLSELAQEDSEFNPQSLYAETKVRAEELLADSNAIILRLGTLHGLSPRMRFDLVVNVMTRDAVDKGEIYVYGGAQTRPLLHVKDAAEIIRYLTGWTRHTGVRTYNVATENWSVANLAEEIAALTRAKLVKRGSMYEDSRSYELNVDKAKEDGILPSMHRGIDCSVEEIRKALVSKRIKDPYHRRYVNARALPRLGG